MIKKMEILVAIILVLIVIGGCLKQVYQHGYTKGHSDGNFEGYSKAYEELDREEKPQSMVISDGMFVKARSIPYSRGYVDGYNDGYKKALDDNSIEYNDNLHFVEGDIQ